MLCLHTFAVMKANTAFNAVNKLQQWAHVTAAWGPLHRLNINAVTLHSDSSVFPRYPQISGAEESDTLSLPGGKSGLLCFCLREETVCGSGGLSMVLVRTPQQWMRGLFWASLRDNNGCRWWESERAMWDSSGSGWLCVCGVKTQHSAWNPFTVQSHLCYEAWIINVQNAVTQLCCYKMKCGIVLSGLEV